MHLPDIRHRDGEALSALGGIKNLVLIERTMDRSERVGDRFCEFLRKGSRLHALWRAHEQLVAQGLP